MSLLSQVNQLEYTMLKTEQIERIKTRNAYMGATLLVVLAAAGGALQAEQPALLLAIPPVCAVAGWYWLREDLHIVAIRRHIRDKLAPPVTAEAGAPVWQWEADDRSLSSKVIQTVANLATFAAPGLAALVVWLSIVVRDAWPTLASGVYPPPTSPILVSPAGWVVVGLMCGLLFIGLLSYLIVYTTLKERLPWTR